MEARRNVTTHEAQTIRTVTPFAVHSGFVFETIRRRRPATDVAIFGAVIRQAHRVDIIVGVQWEAETVHGPT